ncbi:AAA family ATPase, partial [Acinetobacter baumannii]|uniref:AAA family ATPase n=1 Tax=Acinetobacter baumannii TaxID=470 RepID=UPI0037C9B89B
FDVPLELIVIDTFNKATPGANENDGKDMGVVLARCDRIRQKTGAHVMLVHHLNAGGTKARGHTSLFANVENVILCRYVPEHSDA